MTEFEIFLHLCSILAFTVLLCFCRTKEIGCVPLDTCWHASSLCEDESSRFIFKYLTYQFVTILLDTSTVSIELYQQTDLHFHQTI
ncbi:hypothetical protein BpHYR1_040429 [Brachionus plicatilis]|uniref:Secreted protein n=1 Tax=Brachionus plicatilis TaxID=10195 RepID=A0A3M7RLH9_BRAPC|nr:hypothetical protein BpHYR1_040429 [Brachionus plicatilis]